MIASLYVKESSFMKNTFCASLATFLLLSFTAHPAVAERHAVPKEHPRLFGNAAELKTLAGKRPQEFQRMKSVALIPRSAD